MGLLHSVVSLRATFTQDFAQAVQLWNLFCYTNTMKTDTPMKMAVRYYPEDFCSWVLGEKIIEASFQDKEFARNPKKYFLDSLLEVVTAKGQKRLVHIEFQSAGNPTPMAVRMLMYFAMLAEYYGTVALPIDIIVIYIGKGVGKNDTGDHALGVPQLGNFSYRVIHLWQYDAADILASDHPTLLSLIGQSKFSNPTQEVTAAFKKIAALDDAKTRENLTDVLMMLLPEGMLLERIIKMAQDYAIDTPYMRMIRDMEIMREEREAELSRARERSRDEGFEEGREEGRQEGSSFARRGDIIDILQARFGINEEDSQAIARRLLDLSAPVLAQVLIQAATCPDKESFMQLLIGHQA